MLGASVHITSRTLTTLDPHPSTRTACSPPKQHPHAQVNAIDLPEFPLRHGLRLPPNDDCLVMPNWEVLPPSQLQQLKGGGGQQQPQQQQQQRQQRGSASGAGGAAPMDTS
jgi:hypothetical protein